MFTSVDCRKQTNRGTGGVGAGHPALRAAGDGRPGAAHQERVERAAALRDSVAFYGGEQSVPLYKFCFVWD